MTDEQIINSLNHMAEQSYIRGARRSVCKHAAERIETLVNELQRVTATKVD